MRCVNVTINKKKPNVIKLTSFSSCLLVPSYFYDARKFEKATKGQKTKGKSERNFMKNYSTTTDKNQITAIRKVHQSKAISVT